MASKMKMALGAVGAGVAVVVLAAGCGIAWAKTTVSSKLAQTFDAHTADFPIPFPLTEEELEALRAERAPGPPPEGEDAEAEPTDPLEGVDLDALALERARARGKHFVESIYVCVGCHGADFSGGTMVDDGAMGTWLGSNITTGGKTADYAPSDWDRVVRHGILPDGRGAIMPSEDFVAMSDRELSDIVAYIQSVEPSDKPSPAPTFGPIGTMLVATGKIVRTAEKIEHATEHRTFPPPVSATAEYGQHIIQVCTGCHRGGLEGGPMPFGPPDWPPAGNLTMHESGLAGWTVEDFKTAMRDGTSKDGTVLRAPMSEVMPFARNATDVELEAMFLYLESAPKLATGE